MEKIYQKAKIIFKPKYIFEFLKSYPLRSSFIIAIFFSYIYANARINERYNLVRLDAQLNLFSTNEEEFYPPTGALFQAGV